MSSDVRDVDEKALEEAQSVLGTKNPTDTVNAALREVARRTLIHSLLGDFAARDVAELETYRRQAWSRASD